jgi:SulP family sulfate permease
MCPASKCNFRLAACFIFSLSNEHTPPADLACRCAHLLFWQLSAADIAVWLVTLTLTLVTDLTFAVEFGMILAALTFIRKVSRTTTVTRVTRDYVEDSRVHVLQGKDIPEYAVVYRVHGPFLFGATDKFAEILDELDSLPAIVILRLRNMTAIDATGLGAIRELADRVHSSGRHLLLCGARQQPAHLMKQAEFERRLGAENICPSISDALQRAAALRGRQEPDSFAV